MYLPFLRGDGLSGKCAEDVAEGPICTSPAANRSAIVCVPVCSEDGPGSIQERDNQGVEKNACKKVCYI